MRELRYSLEQVMNDTVRFPAYKLYAFDPTLDSISDIIAETYDQTPLDLTPYCSDISWSPQSLSFQLADPDDWFHSDFGDYLGYLQDTAVIRLKEGDDRVDEEAWIWTFTGLIKGQVGWSADKVSKKFTSKVTVYSRENAQAFKRRKITTPEYTVGTDLGIMLRDIATTFMNLAAAEFNNNTVPPILGRSFYHKTNQISQETPWSSISVLLEVLMKVPFFDGEGRLSAYEKSLTRLPNLILPDSTEIFTYEITATNTDAINKVIVVFLDSVLEKIEAPDQVLGMANITSGFFTTEEKLDCYWSDDRKQRAENTRMKIIKSINDNLLPIGEESYQEIDPYHGRITLEISIFVPILATAMLAAYVAAAFIPDSVVVPSFGVFPTISVGKVVQATALIGILAIMMSLGSAQYEVWGTPYDMAYVEKRTIAVVDGVAYYDENIKELKNDFIGTHDWADAVALCELTFEYSKTKARRLVITDYLGLEVGDIIQLPDGRRFFIQDMKKAIRRGIVPKLDISGFKVMTY